MPVRKIPILKALSYPLMAELYMTL